MLQSLKTDIIVIYTLNFDIFTMEDKLRHVLKLSIWFEINSHESKTEMSKTFSACQTFGLTNLENLSDRMKTCQTEYRFLHCNTRRTRQTFGPVFE